jgi:hypothetical protein
MSRGPTPTLSGLPDAIPIFPLAGVLLLPGGRLPLNIFEPRYLTMTTDALGGDRLIGMVQPRAPEKASRAGSVGDGDDVYPIGCAGRIAEFRETPDGRYVIALNGICRFRIAGELPLEKGYRRVRAEWADFAADLDEARAGPDGVDDMLAALRSYATFKGLDFDGAAIRATAPDVLVTSLAMLLPFHAGEKQALLECGDAGERARLLTQLMTMAAHETDDDYPAPAARH